MPALVLAGLADMAANALLIAIAIVSATFATYAIKFIHRTVKGFGGGGGGKGRGRRR